MIYILGELFFNVSIAIFIKEVNTAQIRKVVIFVYKLFYFNSTVML